MNSNSTVTMVTFSLLKTISSCMRDDTVRECFDSVFNVGLEKDCLSWWFVGKGVK